VDDRNYGGSRKTSRKSLHHYASVWIYCILSIMHSSGLPLSNRSKLEKHDRTHRLAGGLKRAPWNELHPPPSPAQE